MIPRYRILSLLLLLAVAAPARAVVVVAPNSNASIEGSADTLIPFSSLQATFQWVFDDSQFAGIPLGSKITGIGFRLDGGATGQASSLSFSQWNLQISQSLNAPGALSATFQNNIGADVMLVRSGPLILAANSFIGGMSANPFTTIAFNLPYTYAGGDLLLTLRHSGFFDELEKQPLLDAVRIPLEVADSGGDVTSSSSATASNVHFFNVPVTQLVLEPAAVPPVPEPEIYALMLVGLGVVGWMVKRRRRENSQCC